MKVLAQRTPLAVAAPFDLEAVKEHIRAVDAADDYAITVIAHAAAAELEQFAQIALLNQAIRVTIFDPVQEGGFWLPIGPVSDENTPTVSIDGQPFTAFDFVGGNRPYMRWQAAYHDLTPSQITIDYQAGFGVAASDIPHDLSQALMDQAALHYDGRSPMDAKSLTTSPHMARIGARYRGVQL